MTEHKVIYLEPECSCGEFAPSERQWCQDDVWSGACEGCGKDVKAVRYVLEAGKP